MSRLRIGRWLDVIARLRFRAAEVAPIIVLGNQKSGTSAIASLLAKAAGLSYVIDIPDFWGDRFKQLRAGQLSMVSAIRRCHKNFALDLVKEPNLTFLYPEIKQALPRARFVFVVRDPIQNIRSIAERLKLSDHDLMSDSNVTASFSEGWRAVFDDPQLYGSGSRHWTCGRMLAQRWKVAAGVYLQSPHEFEMIRYEDFVTDKVGSISRLAGKLDLVAKHDISGDVDVAYQPSGAKRLVVPSQLVDTFPEILGAEATELGYEITPLSHQTRAA